MGLKENESISLSKKQESSMNNEKIDNKFWNGFAVGWLCGLAISILSLWYILKFQ